jgi:hypothetical protein
MISLSEQKSFLDRETFAPGIFSSETILKIALPNGRLSKEGAITELIGELLFRQWLFKDQLPAELKELIEHPELSEVRQALDQDDLDSLDKFKKSKDYLDDRIEAFERADGIIALVDSDNEEALPIPFTLIRNRRRSGVWDNSESEPQEIGVWSEYQQEIDELLGMDINSVRLELPLGPYARMIEGRSLMLPLALAIARIKDPTLPKPIEVLASGVVSGGRIEQVAYLKEKILLAKRMGARIVAVMDEPPDHSFVPEKSEKLTTFIERWQARFGKVLPPMLESHFESWRTHIENFRKREKLVGQILSRLKGKDNGGHVALVSPEGMGKSALLSHVSEVLFQEANSSQKYQGSRAICPWLPGCLLHMGKFGSDPHAVTESLLTQANAMISEPVSFPEKPPTKEAQKLQERDYSDKPTPNYEEIYRSHKESLGKAMTKLVNEKGELYLLIDALDEVTIDKGFLSIFPDPFPQGVRVMITGRNCSQIDLFMDRRSGFERIEPQKLEREEIPAITGVAEDSDDAKQFNDKVYQKTGGWTYAVKETEKRIKQNNGVFSDDLVCNREETLNRMANAWKGQLLEDALEFLVLDEFFNCLTHGSVFTDDNYLYSNISSGNYSGSYYNNARGPKLKDLLSYLKFRGHDLKSRQLNETLLRVRDQIVFNSFTCQKKGHVREESLSFALRIFTQYCLEKLFAPDLEMIIEQICNWLVCSKDQSKLWRLDFLMHEIENFETADSQIDISLNWKKIGDECWSKIIRTWDTELIIKIREDLIPEYSLYRKAVLEAARRGDEWSKQHVASAKLGLYHSVTFLNIGYDFEEGIKMLEQVYLSNRKHAGSSAFYLGCFFLGYDGEQMSGEDNFRNLWLSGNKEFPYYDASKGISYLERSMDIGYPQAKFFLGLLYLKDDFVFFDRNKGIQFLEEISSERSDFEDYACKSFNAPPLHAAADKFLGWAYFVEDFDKAEKYFISAIQKGDWELGVDLLKMFFNEINSKNNTDLDLLSVTEKFLLETLNSMLKREGRGGVSFESSIESLTNDIVGQEKPERIGWTTTNFIEKNKIFGFFKYPVWEYLMYKVFDGMPFWIYLEDTEITNYRDWIEEGTLKDSRLQSLGWNNNQVKEYKQAYSDSSMRGTGIFYILLLNVSETIKQREAGNSYYEKANLVDERIKQSLAKWCKQNESIRRSSELVICVNNALGELEYSKPVISGEFPFMRDGRSVIYKQDVEINNDLTEEEEISRLFCVNGPVAVLPIVDWINWDHRQEDKDWQTADARILSLSESGFKFNDKDLIPWHDPQKYNYPFNEEKKCKTILSDYHWLAREAHPLYDLSVGMLVRHGIYEDPDGLSPKQRFDMARKGGVKVPEWMNDIIIEKK